MVLALTLPALFVAVNVYVVVSPIVRVRDPELDTDPIPGDILTASALLTFQLNTNSSQG